VIYKESTRFNVIERCATDTTQTFYGPFWDHLDEPVPEENFWTLWCKGRLIEADMQTIRLGATPSGLTSAHLHHPHALLKTQKTQSYSQEKELKFKLGGNGTRKRLEHLKKAATLQIFVTFDHESCN